MLVKEATNNAKLLKGRYGPSVTNQLKKGCWIKAASAVIAINGENDRDWFKCRAKFQDLESSTRCKARDQVKERRKTGGGTSSAVPLSEAEELVMQHIPQNVITGRC